MGSAAPSPGTGSMQAIVQVRYGSPDGLELRAIERPEIDEDGVLVRVHAASINASDWHLMRRLPHLVARLLRMRPTRVRGSDLAGEVAAVGRNVIAMAPGDRVFGVGRGSFAEHAATTADRLAPMPRNLSFVEAAALPGAGCTALQGLRDAGQVRAGQSVLVYGAGGGVGTFAVQIAKALGARVTAVSSTGNLDLLRSLGADEVVDYTREDFTRRGERYDVILDVGADRSAADCQRVLAAGGRHVHVGAPPGVRKALALLVKSRLRRRRGGPDVSLLARVDGASLAVLRELAETGRLRAVIDREVPLAGVPDALRHVGTKQARGKVVVRVG